MRTASQLATTGRVLVDALLDLALPSACVGCDTTPGPLCDGCRCDLSAGLFERPLRSTPDPAPIHLPSVTARAPYAGVLRRLVVAYKDGDRRDLRDELSPLLAESLVVASRMREVAVIPMPSSRAAVRRRGDDPVADLVRAAADQLGGLVQVVPALKPVRRLEDQSTLGHRARAANLSGAYAIRSRSQPALEGALSCSPTMSSPPERRWRRPLAPFRPLAAGWSGPRRSRQRSCGIDPENRAVPPRRRTRYRRSPA